MYNITCNLKFLSY